MKLTYSEYWFYSVLEDEEQCRLSVMHQGQEHFCLLRVAGKWGERRTRAIEAIADAIACGEPPGDYTGIVRDALGEPQSAWCVEQ